MRCSRKTISMTLFFTWYKPSTNPILPSVEPVLTNGSKSHPACCVQPRRSTTVAALRVSSRPAKNTHHKKEKVHRIRPTNARAQLKGATTVACTFLRKEASRSTTNGIPQNKNRLNQKQNRLVFDKLQKHIFI